MGRNLFAGLTYIGGVDISFVKGTQRACAMLAVLKFPELKVRDYMLLYVISISMTCKGSSC